MSDTLESRILKVASTNTELPEFPDDKSDLPSDYEYDADQLEEEEIVEEVSENELLKYLDKQENPLHIAQRLFYNEINTVASQAGCPNWQLEKLSCRVVEDLYAHGWATVDGLIDLSTLKGMTELYWHVILTDGWSLGARAEAEQLLKKGAFTRASALSENDPDDPFRDGTARDDWITW